LKDNPRYIIERADHFEVHYDKAVEFYSLDNKFLGKSKSHKYHSLPNAFFRLIKRFLRWIEKYER